MNLEKTLEALRNSHVGAKEFPCREEAGEPALLATPHD